MFLPRGTASNIIFPRPLLNFKPILTTLMRKQLQFKNWTNYKTCGNKLFGTIICKQRAQVWKCINSLLRQKKQARRECWKKQRQRKNENLDCAVEEIKCRLAQSEQWKMHLAETYKDTVDFNMTAQRDTPVPLSLCCNTTVTFRLQKVWLRSCELSKWEDGWQI